MDRYLRHSQLSVRLSDLKTVYLGVLVNANLAYTDAKLKASTSGGKSAQSDGSLFAPLPAVGPTFRSQDRLLGRTGERQPGLYRCQTEGFHQWGQKRTIRWIAICATPSCRSDFQISRPFTWAYW